MRNQQVAENVRCLCQNPTFWWYLAPFDSTWSLQFHIAIETSGTFAWRLIFKCLFTWKLSTLCLSIWLRLSNPEQPKGLRIGKLRDPDFLTSFQSMNRWGALVSFYLTPRSAGPVGLEVEMWREEEEPRTILTHNPLVLAPLRNPGKREDLIWFIEQFKKTSYCKRSHLLALPCNLWIICLMCK